MKRQFLIAGLGRFGMSLATYLESMGGEVMVVDSEESRVNEIADYVTHSLIADTTEERVIKDLGVEQFDEVICAIGTNIEASLMTTMLLREFGAKKLTSKASTELHGRLLEKIGADRVVYPERDMASKIAKEFMATPGIEELLAFSVSHKMFEISAPAQFNQRSLKDLHLRAKFGINVIAIRRGEDINVSPGADAIVRGGDKLVVVGDVDKTTEALRSLE